MRADPGRGQCFITAASFGPTAVGPRTLACASRRASAAQSDTRRVSRALDPVAWVGPSASTAILLAGSAADRIARRERGGLHKALVDHSLDLWNSAEKQHLVNSILPSCRHFQALLHKANRSFPKRCWFHTARLLC